MPIIRSRNGHGISLDIDLDYSDLPNNTVNCEVLYGSFEPNFFIDINDPAIKTLIENKDERLFNLLMDLNQEAKRLLEKQIADEEMEIAN